MFLLERSPNRVSCEIEFGIRLHGGGEIHEHAMTDVGQRRHFASGVGRPKAAV